MEDLLNNQTEQPAAGMTISPEQFDQLTAELTAVTDKFREGNVPFLAIAQGEFMKQGANMAVGYHNPHHTLPVLADLIETVEEVDHSSRMLELLADIFGAQSIFGQS